MNDRIEKVHALADGELPLEESRVTSHELQGDAELAREYQWAVYLPELLRAKCAPVSNDVAWAAARARLDALDAVRSDSRVDRFVGRWSWALAACLFVVIVFAGVLNRGGSTQLNGQQMAGLLGTLGEEQSFSDPEEAVRTLSSQMGGGLPDLRSAVQITGIAGGEVDGHKFAKVSLTDGSGPMLFAIIDQAKGFDGLAPLEGRKEYVGAVVNGTNCVGWSADGRAYLLSGERSMDELISVCDQVRFSEDH